MAHAGWAVEDYHSGGIGEVKGEMIQLKTFVAGWRRRSAMLLDAAGCPRWLVRWRCPGLKGWGAFLDRERE